MAPVRRVALAVLHGIGAQRRDWAEGFVRRVRRTVETRFPGIDVYPEIIWWAPVTQQYEDTLIRRYRRGLSWQWLRRLVIGYGGDVIAYQAPPRHDVAPPWTYRAVHGRIDRRLRVLAALLGTAPAARAPVPLVAVAHSLGSVILSDFVYDAQAAAGPGALRARYVMASVTLRQLTKTFDSTGHPALRDVSLTVPDGEFLVVLGPSGCGKTTALRCIAGLEEPTAGEILIGDRVVTHDAPAARDVAMVFQNYALYPHLTVRQNIAFALEMRRLPAREILRRVAEASDRLGLGELLERRPAQLSSGQRQRVALGRAIVREPPP